MTTTRELGQSEASAKALAAITAATDEASVARGEVATLQRRLREARKALKVADKAHADAIRTYENTPFGESA